jgi:DNA-binding IclR family transcriptional regulator
VDVPATLTCSPDRRQRMVDIADHMCVSKSGVTQIVDRLEAAGMVAREASAADCRLVYAGITTAGSAVLDKAGPVVAALAHEHIAGSCGLRPRQGHQGATHDRRRDSRQGGPLGPTPCRRKRPDSAA